MQTQRQNVIHEKSNIILIKQNLSTPMKINSPSKGEYSLKQNFFDPSKSSPPNEFMIKLHMRINRYHMDNKDDSLDIE
jgi:hypothetical protein